MRLRVMIAVGLCVVGVALAAEAGGRNETGRWKGDGAGGCYWDDNDDGPDQCDPNAPAQGRWKVGGDGACSWDASDSGPNQCSGASLTVAVQKSLLEIAAIV